MLRVDPFHFWKKKLGEVPKHYESHMHNPAEKTQWMNWSLHHVGFEENSTLSPSFVKSVRKI